MYCNSEWDVFLISQLFSPALRDPHSAYCLRGGVGWRVGGCHAGKLTLLSVAVRSAVNTETCFLLLIVCSCCCFLFLLVLDCICCLLGVLWSFFAVCWLLMSVFVDCWQLLFISAVCWLCYCPFLLFVLLSVFAVCWLLLPVFAVCWLCYGPSLLFVDCYCPFLLFVDCVMVRRWGPEFCLWFCDLCFELV